jgi:hypothetical protein
LTVLAGAVAVKPEHNRWVELRHGR